MRKLYNILLVLLLLGIGFFIGEFSPWNILSVDTNSNLSRADYYTLVVDIAAAVGTIMAVFVALFLPEIRAYFKHVIYSIKFQYTNCNEELVDVRGHKKASKYYNYLEINNNGNANAKDCELYLEKASFCDDANNKSDIEVDREPIEWRSGSTMVYIPAHAKKTLRFIEMLEPIIESNPDGNDVSSPPKYNIIGIGEIDAQKGKWNLEYILYSANAKPKKITIEIYWNGIWEKRLSDINGKLTINLK